MGIKESEIASVDPDIKRGRARPFEVRLYARSEGLRFCPYGEDDLGPETGSGYKCPAPVTADSRYIYEVPFGLSEGRDQGEDFRREAIDEYE